MVQFFCYRESRGFADMELSLIGESLITAPKGKACQIVQWTFSLVIILRNLFSMVF